MSRLIKKPILIPTGVAVKADGGLLIVKGPKGEERVKIPPEVTVKAEGEGLWITGTGAGTTWALVRNAVEGVTEGFLKILEIEGVGYRAALEGKDLVLYLGYANPVRMKIPAGVSVTIKKIQ